MSWHGTKKASKLPSMDKKEILVFDTETTGLSSVLDEIIQITILDGYGSVLFNSYIKPTRHETWSDAERINHISPNMVSNAPYFHDVRSHIQNLFNHAKLVVGYNVDFDINFVTAAGIVVSGQKFDVMMAFKSYISDIEKKPHYKCRLTQCAEYFGYSYTPHDSVEDANATLFCFNQLIGDPRFTTYKKAKRKETLPHHGDENSPRRIDSNGIDNHIYTSNRPKIKYSYQHKTHRKWPLAFKGLLLLLIGQAIYYYTCRRLLLPSKEFGGYVLSLFQQRPINIPELIAVVLILVGVIVLILGIIKFFIKMPHWIVVKIKRLFNR